MQAAFIVVVTAVAFNVSWGDPFAARLLIALFGLVAARRGAAGRGAVAERRPGRVAGGVRGSRAGGAGRLHGPVAIMPDAMQSIGRLIPHSWALLGLQELIRGGGGIETVLPNVLVLAVYGVVLMGVAGWRFRKAISG